MPVPRVALIDPRPPRRRRHRLTGAVAVALTLGTAAVTASPASALPGDAAAAVPTTPPPAPSATIPDSPAGRQLTWLLDASGRLPLTEAEIREHLTPQLLALVSPDKLDQDLASVVARGQLRLARLRSDLPQVLGADLTAGPVRLSAMLTVNARGVVDQLGLTPADVPVTSPASWDDVDAVVRPLAPEVRVLVADTSPKPGRPRGEACRPLHAIEPDSPGPLGSAFKLVVLGTLAGEIATHTRSWDQPVSIRPELKSLPSGVTQFEPDGTTTTVENLAGKMIALSDNTAADHLAALAGRRRIEAAQSWLGISRPERNVPFLRTRELFQLKMQDWPAQAQAYTAADRAGRREQLAHLDPTWAPTNEDAQAWMAQPRAVDTLEWFASPTDECRLLETLARLDRRPGGGRVGDVLSVSDAGLGLDPAVWPEVWFKGGSEPGLLHAAYRAVDARGRSFVVVVSLTNPAAPFDDTAFPRLLQAARLAFARAEALAAADDGRHGRGDSPDHGS